MRLSETITIYLAVGAPFGVNYFLREKGGPDGSVARRSLLKATGVGLLWPLVAFAAFLSRQSTAAPLSSTGEKESAIDERLSRRIAAAKQGLLAALDRVRELAQGTTGQPEELEHSTRLAREAIEKYVGLTLSVAEVGPDDPPASHELELCRIAGRTGDDLLLAGRCIHRRNVARLIAHQSRSRTELLHAMASVREVCMDAHAAWPHTQAAIMRPLGVAVIEFYAQAVNLLTLLEDESAARSAARLLDAECGRLRRLETTVTNPDPLSFTAPSRAVVQ
jgi:hypothetical protein